MELQVEQTDIRIDQYLAQELDISRSKIQKLMKQEKITVNGKKVNSSYLVKIGDMIVVDDNLDFSITVDKENIPLDIVYEDDYLLVVNKKSGMVVHPAPGNYHGTLVNALLYRFSLLLNMLHLRDCRIPLSLLPLLYHVEFLPQSGNQSKLSSLTYLLPLLPVQLICKYILPLVPSRYKHKSSQHHHD